MSKRADLTGRKFGELVAVRYVGEAKWLCRCSCGAEKEVLAQNLVRGHTRSCGHSKDRIGEQHGKLKIISKLPNGYMSICECGEERFISAKTLAKQPPMMCEQCARHQQAAAVRSKVFDDGTQPSKIKLDKEPTKANKSGVVGVNWDKSRGKWQASLRFKGHKYNLGRFDNLQDAIDARRKAEEEIYLPYIEGKNKNPGR